VLALYLPTQKFRFFRTALMFFSFKNLPRS